MLYDNNKRLTDLGVSLDTEVFLALQPIIQKYIALGAKIRDIRCVAEGAVLLWTLSEKNRMDAERIARGHLGRNGIDTLGCKVDVLKIYEAVKSLLPIE